MSSVLIKDVDKQLYSQFKAEAALRGIKIGEALQMAMQKWLSEQQENDEIENQRIKNNALFRQILPDLIEEHAGEWVVVANNHLEGIFSTKSDALEYIRKNLSGSTHNLISPITMDKRKIRLGFGRVKS